MRLTRKMTESYLTQRINIFKRETPCLDESWHYHPQYELIYIDKGSGMRYVGDNVAQFSSGELVLVGTYVPHLWRNENGKNRVHKIILQFAGDILSRETFKQEEFVSIHQLLNDSKLGISFGKSVIPKIHEQLLNMVDSSSTVKLLELLNILHQLSLTEDKQELSSVDMYQFTDKKAERLEEVIAYISNNYPSEIKLKDISEIAHMTPNSFCRFFKKQTGKSFSQFLNEVRIKNAVRLLDYSNMTIANICYSVGYNSLTNFYKQFKSIVGQTPNKYRMKVKN